jgi:hypothetical protein
MGTYTSGEEILLWIQIPHVGLILDITGSQSDPSRVYILDQGPVHSLSHDLKIFLGKARHHFTQLQTTVCSTCILYFPDRHHLFEIVKDILKDAFEFTSGYVLKHDIPFKDSFSLWLCTLATGTTTNSTFYRNIGSSPYS